MENKLPTHGRETIMIQIVAGKKGEGKTKYMLDKANSAVTDAEGTIVYLDKSAQHMYELNSNVRLVNITDYPVNSYEAFIGFVSGIIARDFDLQQVYFDSFLKISAVADDQISQAIETLKILSDQHNITFVVSISMDVNALPENVKPYIVNA
jgi:hypothetical protein